MFKIQIRQVRLYVDALEGPNQVPVDDRVFVDEFGICHTLETGYRSWSIARKNFTSNRLREPKCSPALYAKPTDLGRGH